jgi:toxin ParE1/3/4
VTPARLTRRPLAEEDVDAAVDWLIVNASAAAGLSFIDALEAALVSLREHPFSGADWSHRIGIPGFRALLLDGHPYVVLHMASPTAVDIVRVLHTSRDIEWELLRDER